ncbi:hypothetical protein NDU88_004671 [Pleurodeles waltl]|uniref:Uncharacterized protein n=1 Tax=Pleurodeles waltl TaxID=8319 RepID=A0AAV7VKZ4_PLEWA|nr:hypothetical protein NDU88_004671 [Pleurodeles waltl]
MENDPLSLCDGGGSCGGPSDQEQTWETAAGCDLRPCISELPGKAYEAWVEACTEESTSRGPVQGPSRRGQNGAGPHATGSYCSGGRCTHWHPKKKLEWA